jgi:hypothetical protein
MFIYEFDTIRHLKILKNTIVGTGVRTPYFSNKSTVLFGTVWYCLVLKIYFHFITIQIVFPIYF